MGCSQERTRDTKVKMHKKQSYIIQITETLSIFSW